MEVIRLLRSKNRCLMRFLEASKEFLQSAEQGDFSLLDTFQDSREAALKALELYDGKVSEAALALTAEHKTRSLILEIEAEMLAKNAIVQDILAIDQKIMACLDGEKARVGQEIVRSRKSGDAIKKFKSAWMPESGEELDKQL